MAIIGGDRVPFTKIKESDMQGKGVQGQPDVPGLPAAEMQRKVEEIVKSLSEGEAVKSGGRKIAPKRAKLPEEFNLLKQQLSNFFSAKVQLTCSEKGKGKISIPFSNEEELERIIGILDTLKNK